MKTNSWQKALATLAIAGLGVSAGTVQAQYTPVASPAPASTPAQALPYGVSQVLQLVQAKVSDDTIIAYINNAHISYNIDANQIIYLRQLGISDPVLKAMLNQPRVGGVPAAVAYTPPLVAPTAPAPAPVAAPATPAPAVTYVQPQPPVTYVQPQPSVVYVQSPPQTVYYAQPASPPWYSYIPPVSLSFGWIWGNGGGGYHGGGGWHH